MRCRHSCIRFFLLDAFTMTWWYAYRGPEVETLQGQHGARLTHVDAVVPVHEGAAVSSRSCAEDPSDEGTLLVCTFKMFNVMLVQAIFWWCSCVRCTDVDRLTFGERLFRGSIAESAASGDEVLLNIPLSLTSRDGLVGGRWLTLRYRRTVLLTYLDKDCCQIRHWHADNPNFANVYVKN